MTPHAATEPAFRPDRHGALRLGAACHDAAHGGRAPAALATAAAAAFAVAALTGASARAGDGDLAAAKAALESQNETLRHRLDVLERQLDQMTLDQRVSDIANTWTALFNGPPRRYQPNPTAPGAGNVLRLRAQVFVPKFLDLKKKHPLVVLVHGGVHLWCGSWELTRLREMLEQGYVVVAPEYRGSSGFGQEFFDAIDYGGLEVEDTWAAREFMVETYGFVDGKRVGVVGWSHGGLHALMNIFDHPDGYAAAFAGMPVSDLVARMGYSEPGYHEMFAAKSHIGKHAWEDPAEYRRRSPTWNVQKYRGTPLLIHSTTNDEDVNVMEVEGLIRGLKANGKAGFESKIFQNAPGGHAFEELDTKYAHEARQEIWRFLAKHLKPERPVK